jgi:hypothetical protein
MEINHQVIKEYIKSRIDFLEDEMKTATKVNELQVLYGKMKELTLLVDFINK